MEFARDLLREGGVLWGRWEGKRQLTFVSCPEQMPEDWSPTNVSLKWPSYTHWASIFLLFMGLYKVELQKTHELLVCVAVFSPSPYIGLYSSLGLKTNRSVHRYGGVFWNFYGTTWCENINSALSQKALHLLSHFPSIFKTHYNLCNYQKEVAH